LSRAPRGVAPPPPGAYWVDPGRLLAGAYPGHGDPDIGAQRIRRLLELGIDWFVDLTWPDELPQYETLLPSPYDPAARAVTYSRRPIRDHGVPTDPLQMVEILDEIEEALAGGRRVYVHCRAGIGRTGTVVGCLLARRCGDGEAALAALEQRWIEGGRLQDWPQTPETDEQTEFVRRWHEQARRPAPPHAAPRVDLPPGAQAADQMRERYRGLLLGLALGDALGASLQHRRPGSYTPVADLLGGGPYELPRGAWSDDTALALVTAESLLACGGFDGRDFVQRAQRWQREGHLSATGQCLGISAATAAALAQAGWSGKPYAGSHDPARAHKEPLVRAGVVAAWALPDPEQAIRLAAEAARPTHQAPVALDACRYWAAIVIGLLRGTPRLELLAPNYTPAPGLWERHPLKAEVAAVAAGSWRRLGEPASGLEPVADGNAAEGLALALWALARGRSYRDTVLTAVNLGLDADTNGALVGQLAGALYGASSLPPAWLAALVAAADIATTADRLLASALWRTTAA
jgi:ADP-ribosyl-[dinitrogen reductase] hydrolase